MGKEDTIYLINLYSKELLNKIKFKVNYNNFNYLGFGRIIHYNGNYFQG